MKQIIDLIKIEVSNIHFLKADKNLALKEIMTMLILALSVAVYGYIFMQSINDTYIRNSSIIVVFVLALLASSYEFFLNVNAILYNYDGYQMLCHFPIETYKIVLAKEICLILSILRWQFIIGFSFSIVYVLFLHYSIAYLFSCLLILISSSLAICILGGLLVVFCNRNGWKLSVFYSMIFLIIGIGIIRIFIHKIKYEIVLIVNQVLMLLSDPTYALWFLFVHVFLFMLLLLLVEKTYVSTMCRIEHKRKCKKKIKSQSKQNSVVKALCLKEKRGFWSSGLYVTNTMVCIAVFSVVLLGICFVPEKLVKDVLLQTGMGTEIKIMLPMLLAFVVGMSCPTYCSLSFEGKSMGVLKSMPISFRELLISKVQFYVMLVFPFVLVDAAMLEYVVNRQLQIIELVPLLILPLIFSIVIGVIGLWLDMMFGSFEWISPVSIIKQNVTLPLMMLVCVTLSGIPASFVFGLHMEPWMAYGVTVLLWIGFGLGFYVLTKKRAKRRLYM